MVTHYQVIDKQSETQAGDESRHNDQWWGTSWCSTCCWHPYVDQFAHSPRSTTSEIAQLNYHIYVRWSNQCKVQRVHVMLERVHCTCGCLTRPGRYVPRYTKWRLRLSMIRETHQVIPITSIDPVESCFRIQSLETKHSNSTIRARWNNRTLDQIDPSEDRLAWQGRGIRIVLQEHRNNITFDFSCTQHLCLQSQSCLARGPPLV